MKRSLPQSLDQVGGMRAARWFRESTAGQWDNFGPDAQREQQDRAIARYGLADTGLEWSVASSGWTSAWRTPTWEAMVASARSGGFDVLVVGYVSRFLRNLKQTLIAVEDHLRVWHPRTGTVVARGPVITWATRSKAREASSLAWAALARAALAASNTVRIGVHPGDITSAPVRASITATIAHFAARRSQKRYGDFLSQLPTPHEAAVAA